MDFEQQKIVFRVNFHPAKKAILHNNANQPLIILSFSKTCSTKMNTNPYAVL
jgi:hypothetical protein